MSQVQKLVEKLLSRPKDFTWEELLKVLSHLGYTELKKGKKGVSRRKFADETGHIISLHKPHPRNILKHYQINQLIATLKERGKLKDD